MKKIQLTMTAVMVLLALQPGFSQTIVGSKHDFSGKTWNTSVGSQICIVCHTPHNAVTIAEAPLWNHGLTASIFALYTSTISTTFNATPGQPDGTSKLCLSCHDGTVAVDNYGGRTTGTFFVSGKDSLGINLSNDHPVSFTYDAALVTADGGGLRATTFASGIGGGTIAEKMLFGGKMQCASCHDVHNTSSVPVGLLVKSNAASALCLTCHIK